MTKLTERYRKTETVPQDMIEYTENNITVTATGMTGGILLQGSN